MLSTTVLYAILMIIFSSFICSSTTILFINLQYNVHRKDIFDLERATCLWIKRHFTAANVSLCVASQKYICTKCKHMTDTRFLYCLRCIFPVVLYYTRVSSKQTKINFGSNRNKPKQDLFRVCFGLFRETKKKNFSVVSVFRTYIETTETNRTVSKRTETIRKFLTNRYLNMLSFKIQLNKNKKKKCLPKHFLSWCCWAEGADC